MSSNIPPLTGPPYLSTAMLVTCVLVVSNSPADEPVRSETVKFQDPNVSTPAGVEALYSRIHSAAKRVCVQTDPVLQAAAIACARTAEEGYRARKTAFADELLPAEDRSARGSDCRKA